MAIVRSPCAQAALELLPKNARLLGIELTEKQVETFGRFCDLLLKANRDFNLTSIDEPTKVVTAHFVDSLTIALALPSDAATRRLSVVDVGAGAGLPGLALAIAFPHWNVTLVESVGKKCRFMAATAHALRLHANIVCERAEIVGRSERREAFDVALARAVGRVTVLVEYCAPLVRPGGSVVLYKSGDVDAEISEAELAMSELACRFTRTAPVPALADLSGHRLVVLEKIGHVPSRYPRRVGLARSRPLRRDSNH